MVEWLISERPVLYPDAVEAMETRVAAIRSGQAAEQIWLLEHPPLFTAGSSARTEDLLDPRFPVYQTGRGGQMTYHGPGQRVAYVMLDLKARYEGTPDLRHYVWSLEEWLIQTLKSFGVDAERRQGRVGLWVVTGEGDAKIAALGVRIRHGVSYHGVALNVSPTLEHFQGIVPCGLREFGVTSLQAMGKEISMQAIDEQLKKSWSFG